tara:strand:+ start:7569 stop:7970 length:402 start_codon:yes stop_codon:yes gene_type:complete
MDLNQLIKIVISALEDVKASDIEVLDVVKMPTIFERVIIASAISTRQAKAIASNVHAKVKEYGGMVYGIEGENSGEWVLVDLGSIVVHIMLPPMRIHYNLEGLWGELETGVVGQEIIENKTKDKSTLTPNRFE